MGTAGKGKPRRTGRPIKITQRPDPAKPDTYGSRVLEALGAGAFLDDACAYAGISPATVYDAISNGKDVRALLEEHEQPLSELTDDQRAFLEFSESVQRARATIGVLSLAVIRSAAAKGTWQAAAWYLERTMPQKYGRFQRLAIEAPVALSSEAARAALLGLDDGYAADD